jgi:hypothetical protein
VVLPGIGIDSFQEAQMTCYKTAINMTKKQINQSDYVFGTSVKFTGGNALEIVNLSRTGLIFKFYMLCL